MHYCSIGLFHGKHHSALLVSYWQYLLKVLAMLYRHIIITMVVLVVLIVLQTVDR